jgi:hypothetical protein
MNITLTKLKIECLAHVSDAAKWDITWKPAVPRPPWRLEDWDRSYRRPDTKPVQETIPVGRAESLDIRKRRL